MLAPKHLSIIIITCLFGFFCIKKLKQASFIPISDIKIFGKLEYTDYSELESKINAAAKRGFFDCNTVSLQNELQQMLWIAKVGVEKHWPGILMIELKEKQPVAVLNKQYIVFKDGKHVKLTKQQLPKLSSLLKLEADSNNLGEVLEVKELVDENIKTLGLAIINLQNKIDVGWQVTLNNDILLIVGHNNLEERLQKFVAVYEASSPAFINSLHRIDLRYTNGLAVS